MATLKPLPNLVTLNEKAIWEDFQRLNADIAVLTAAIPAVLVSSVILAPDSATRNRIQADGAYPDLILRAPSTGTPHLLDFESSSGTIIAYFDSDGQLTMSRAASGSNVDLTVANTSTTANSNARLILKTGGTTGSGFASLIFDYNAATAYKGISTQSSDSQRRMMFHASTVPNATTTLMCLDFSLSRVGIGTLDPLGDLNVHQGGNTPVSLLVTNSATGSPFASAIFGITTASSTNAYIRMESGGSNSWALGPNVGASRRFEICSNTSSLGSGVKFAIETGGRPLIAMGSSTSMAALGGVAVQNTSVVGNVGAGEDDLMSYSVPASSLSSIGQSLRFKSAGFFAATTIRIRAYFGSETVFDTGSIAPGSTGYWELEVEIIRSGATTQKAVARWTSGSSALPVSVTYTALTRDITLANTFKVTGEGASNNDITQELMIGEWRNAA